MHQSSCLLQFITNPVVGYMNEGSQAVLLTDHSLNSRHDSNASERLTIMLTTKTWINNYLTHSEYFTKSPKTHCTSRRDYKASKRDILLRKKQKVCNTHYLTVNLHWNINDHFGKTVFLYLEVLLTGYRCGAGDYMGVGNNQSILWHHKPRSTRQRDSPTKERMPGVGIKTSVHFGGRDYREQP